MVNAFFYSNIAVPTTLSGNINNSVTTATVASTTGWPGSFPYIVALDFETANEELVKVTANAAGTLTIERGYGGTTAVSHSTGAPVRHVYNAQDATDFRTHEQGTTGVHGLAGAVVGTTDTQTLTNKTITAPSISNPNITGGGALAGTFSGTPTFSGAATFTGGPSFTTASVLFQQGAAATVAARTRVTGDTQDRFQLQADGGMRWGSGSATQDAIFFRETANFLSTTDTGIRTYRGAAGNNALAVRVAGDTNSRWFINSDGNMNWGPGGGSATDTNLNRSAADTLHTDDSLEVGTNLSVTGNLTVGGIGTTLFARKTADTTRATASLSDDPHLTLSVVANAVYMMDGLIIVDTSDATNADLNLDWTTPASTTGKWIGIGQPTTATGTDGTVRTVTSDVDAARNYGATVDSANQLGILVRGVVVTAGTAGTYAVSWARTGGSGSLTMVTNSFIRLRRIS